MDYKYCFKCGSKIPAKAKHCTQCGVKQPNTEAEQLPKHESITNSEENTIHDYNKSSKKETSGAHSRSLDRVNNNARRSYNNNYGSKRSNSSNAYNESKQPNLINSFRVWVKNWNRLDQCMGRADYWWGILTIIIIGLLVYLAFSCITYIGISIGSDALITFSYCVFWILETLLGFAYYPGSIKRLHDTGRSGWNVCFVFIPFIGVFIVAYLCVQPTNWKSTQWIRN